MAADYYAILKNAIGALPESSGEARRAVYEKARRAVVDQLKSFEPPLSATEITQERLRLEDCIRRVESEAARGILTQTLGRTAAPLPPPSAYREPETRSRSSYDPQAPRSFEPPARQAPPPERAPSRALPPPSSAEPATGYGNGNGNGAYERPTQERTRMGGTPGGYTQQQPYAPPSQPQPGYDPAAYGGQALRQAVHEADQLGAAVAETAQHARDTFLASQDYPTPQPAPEEPTTAQIRARERMQAASVEGELPFGGPTRSRKPLYIALSVGILVIGIGVAALWFQHERIASYLGVQRTFGLGTPRTANGNIPPKSTDRLGNDESPAGKPDSGIKSVQTQQIVPPAVPQPAQPQQAQQQPAAPSQPQPVLPPVAQGGPAAPANGGDVPAAAQPPVPLVAQKVTLMEEGPAGITQPLFAQGKVVWQLVKESPAAGKAPVAVVRARVEIPDRKINLTLSIQPNADASLPASHVIDLRFSVAPDFDGKGIREVPGLIMKPNEQATGQPLAAATAKISSSYFLVALSASDADKTRNLAALKDNGWLTIPVVYDNGKKALISIEKSGAGDKVLSDAFAAWGP